MLSDQWKIPDLSDGLTSQWVWLTSYFGEAVDLPAADDPLNPSQPVTCFHLSEDRVLPMLEP